MKNIKITFLCASALLFSFACNQMQSGSSSVPSNVTLKTDKDKRSYAIGMQVGRSLKSQKVELDTGVLAAAVNDVLKGKDTKLTDDEVRKVMISMREDQRKKMEKEKETNKVEGAAFLAKNKTAKGVVTTGSGLQYTHIKEGTGAKPKADQKVKVHYKGTLMDGTEFDSSYKRNKPAEFKLNQVIKGWTEGLQLMKVGGKTKFFIPSDLAYGSVPRPNIPANSVLLFEVELLDILKDAPAANAKKK